MQPVAYGIGAGNTKFAFQFHLLGFSYCNVITRYGAERQLYQYFQFPLLGFSYCNSFCLGRIAATNRWFFQFPLLGFSYCNFTTVFSETFRVINFQFPLLGFSYCNIHPAITEGFGLPVFFQFPLLGFSYCNRIVRQGTYTPSVNFQFPLLGFSYCNIAFMVMRYGTRIFLSIPFIGIFLLQREGLIKFLYRGVMVFQFPLLGFSYCNLPNDTVAIHPSGLPSFNSLYWDFLIATSELLPRGAGSPLIFQFPLLGFSYCNGQILPRLRVGGGPSFNSLYWDFLIATPAHSRRNSPAPRLFQFPLLGFSYCN